MEQTTICIIDDHAIVRHGLKELLHKMGNYKVIHEFDNGESFLEALPLNPVPQLYILDYSMPHLNGIEVLQKLEEREEELKILLLTQHFDEQIINAAYHHGARGFLHKNCILKRIRNYETSEDKKSNNIVLTQREADFLRLVCDERELTYEQMADIMNLSVKSIEAYRAALFERYNIKSKVGLVLFSYKNRLTEPFL
jgi:DNA-binding NarL/FixJ family response regulator